MRTPEISRLHELYVYERETGLLRRRMSRGGEFAGSIAGTLKPPGYIRINVDRTLLYAHRMAWAMVYGKWPDFLLDHIDGNKANNRIGNLREAPGSLNHQNLSTARSDNKCGLLGVHFRAESQSWVAQIRVNKVHRWLGRFGTAEAAHEAYLDAKRQLHEGCTI